MTRDELEAVIRRALTHVYTWATGTPAEATTAMNSRTAAILRAVDNYVVAECQRIDERRGAL